MSFVFSPNRFSIFCRVFVIIEDVVALLPLLDGIGIGTEALVLVVAKGSLVELVILAASVLLAEDVATVIAGCSVFGFGGRSTFELD